MIRSNIIYPYGLSTRIEEIAKFDWLNGRETSNKLSTNWGIFNSYNNDVIFALDKVQNIYANINAEWQRYVYKPDINGEFAWVRKGYIDSDSTYSWLRHKWSDRQVLLKTDKVIYKSNDYEFLHGTFVSKNKYSTLVFNNGVKINPTSPIQWGYGDPYKLVNHSVTSGYEVEKSWNTYNIERYLILLPSATLVKIAGTIDIPVTQIQLSSQKDSWTWAWSAEVAKRSDLELISPVSGNPVDLLININGYTWRVLSESVSWSYSENSKTYSVSGRSQPAVLTSDYSALHSKTTTQAWLVSQLLDQEVSPYGYSIEFNIQDFTVPAGSFSYTEKSPLEAVGEITKGLNTNLLPTLSSTVLKVQNFYSIDPRTLNTVIPDYSLGQSVIYELNATYRNEPLYDRVWCHGTNSDGVMVRATLNNKAGTSVAPNFSSQILVDVNAGRNAAENILFKGGRWVDVSFSTVVDTASVDLIQVGDIVEIVMDSETFIGFAKSVAIAATGGMDLTVVQNVQLECWLGE